MHQIKYYLVLCRHWTNYHLKLILLRGGVTTWIPTQLACQRFMVFQHLHFIIQVVAVRQNPTQLLQIISCTYQLTPGDFIQMELDGIPSFKPFKRKISIPFGLSIQPPPETLNFFWRSLMDQSWWVGWITLWEWSSRFARYSHPCIFPHL